MFQTKCVILTGFVSAGFTVPFSSFLDDLNFMPSAVKKQTYRKINIILLNTTVQVFAVCWVKVKPP